MSAAKFFMPADEFALGTRQKIRTAAVGREKSKVLILDGFYKNPMRVRELFLDSPAPVWKVTPDSRNFKDYYDCRHAFSMFFGYDQVTSCIGGAVKQEFGFDLQFPPMAVSNIFQLIKPQPKGHSAYPHNDLTRDGKNRQPVNALIYLNTETECRGGTALYRHKESGRESIPTGKQERARFEKKHFSRPGILEDGVNYWCDVDKYWERFHLIEMKFNRLVIFPSQLFHGAWHESNWFKSYPRLNQVFFSQVV